MALAVLAASPPAGAASRVVTDCGDTGPGGAPGQLRHLVAGAVPGDLIRIPACVIVLTGGELPLAIDLGLRGAGPGQTVLDGGALSRVLHVQPGVSVAIAGLTVRNGRAPGAGADGDGGGIRNRGTLTVTNVVVSDNAAARHGGGIANEFRLSLSHATISGNAAGLDSGAIDSPGPSLTLVNTTVSGNQAGRNGGAILTFAGISGSHVTIAGNRADPAGVSGGAGGGTFRIGGLVSLRNSILAGNTAGLGGAPSDCAGSLTVEGPVLVGTLDGCALDGIAPAALVSPDPGLSPLADHGGGTPTHALLPGSPALDAADGACEPVDQTGRRRPQGLRCDLGAYEAPVRRAGPRP